MKKKDYEGYCHSCMVGSGIKNVSKEECRCSCHKNKDWENDFDDYIEAKDGKITFDEIRLFIFKALKKQKKEIREKIEKMKGNRSNVSRYYEKRDFGKSAVIEVDEMESIRNQAIDDILKEL